MAATNASDARIVVRSLQTGQQRDIAGGGATSPKYSPTGHLIYAQGSTLMAVPFDAQQLQAKGAAVPVLEGVAV